MLSWTERMWYAHGALLNWTMNHKSHAKYSQASSKCDYIAELVDLRSGGDGTGRKER